MIDIRVIIIVLIIYAVFFLETKSCKDTNDDTIVTVDNFASIENKDKNKTKKRNNLTGVAPKRMPQQNDAFLENEAIDVMEEPDTFEVASNEINSGYSSIEHMDDNPKQPKKEFLDKLNMKASDKYNAADFLPKEINDEWFDTDFSQAKYNIKDNKLINTEKYVIGVNTVGQSLKNASYDIRGTVPNPKMSVSPWNNSTYEADYNIKSLC